MIFLGLCGCASTQPVGGMLYSDVKGPVTATSHPRGPLHGESCAASYLGLVALGDASISTAAKNGNINVISHIEHNSMSILGFYNRYCLEVWGHNRGAAAPAAPATAPAAPKPGASIPSPSAPAAVTADITQ